MTPTALEALGFFRDPRVDVLAVIRAMDVRSAQEFALVLGSLEDVARFLRWVGTDELRAPELWAELAPFRDATPKRVRRYAFGWRAPKVDAKSPPWMPGPELWELGVPSRASLVDRALRSGVRDQNPRGTCVAFATCKALEILRDDGVGLSPQYLYYHMKQPERDDDTHDDGSYAAVSLDTLEDVGVCAERLMPYRTDDYAEEGEPVCGPPPSRAAVEDARTRCTDTNLLVARSDVASLAAAPEPRAFVEGVRALAAPNPGPAVKAQRTLLRFVQAALSGALGPPPRPVVGCFRWFDSTSRMAGESGRMGLPLPGEPAAGGHAITIVGYADDPDYAGGGYLVIQNSWGEDWPRTSPDGPGLFRMCYAYAVAYLSEAGVPMRPGEHAHLRIRVRERRSERAQQAAATPSSSAASAGVPDATPAPRFCTQCGASLPAGGRFCTQCGAAVAVVPSAQAPATPVFPASQQATNVPTFPTATQAPARPAYSGMGAASAPLGAARARMEETLARQQAQMQATMARLGVGAPVVPHASGRCVYCGSSSHGSCSQSPVGRHKHDCDGGHCAWCGSSSYGSCSSAPHGKHEHGHGRGCRYCGSSSHGSCSYAPEGRHEH